MIYYETKVKVENYLNLLLQKDFVPAINKPTKVSRNNATIIDYINTNHFVNNDVHSGIIVADISDQFPIFLTSKNLLLDSSNEPIHITKREMNDKSIAYLKLFCLLLNGNMCLTKIPKIMRTMNF